jgi:hypothetical protein
VKKGVWCFQFRSFLGLVDECPPSSLYLTVLVIIFWSLDLSWGHMQGYGSQACIGTVQMFMVGPRGWSCREVLSEDWWAQRGHEVHKA